MESIYFSPINPDFIDIEICSLIFYTIFTVSIVYTYSIFTSNLIALRTISSSISVFTIPNLTYLFDWNDRLICHDYGMLIFIYLFYNTRIRNIGSAGFFCIGDKISYRYLLFYTDIISDYIDFFVQLMLEYSPKQDSEAC